MYGMACHSRRRAVDLVLILWQYVFVPVSDPPTHLQGQNPRRSQLLRAKRPSPVARPGVPSVRALATALWARPHRRCP